MVYFEDFIPRNLTSSSVVIEGVKKNENPDYTTMWTVLGWPLASVTIPVWLNNKVGIPSILQYNGQILNAPLCEMALKAKELWFSYKWGTSSKHYMNVNALLNADNSGVMQLVVPLENTILERANKMLANWRADEIDIAEMKNFYDWVDSKVPTYFKENLNICIE